MTDITDGLRELIAEARVPGMYTPSERQAFASHWIGVISPQRLEELLDEIERLRARLTEQSRSYDLLVGAWDIDKAEIERLRSQVHVHLLPDGTYTAAAAGPPHPVEDHGYRE